MLVPSLPCVAGLFGRLGGEHRELPRGLPRDVLDQLAGVAGPQPFAHPAEQRCDQPEQPALHLPTRLVRDQFLPVLTPLPHVIEHRIKHQAFDIDVSTPSPADDIAEFRGSEEITAAPHPTKDQRGRGEVESLGQGRR